MLEPWIIEQIRRREEEERRRERPQLELPISEHVWPGRNERDGSKPEDDDEPKRGVVIIGI